MGGFGGRFHLPFFEHQKSVLIFGKKIFYCIHLFIIIENAILGISRSEKLREFSLRRSLSCDVHEIFIEVPLFQEISPTLKISLEH